MQASQEEKGIIPIPFQAVEGGLYSKELFIRDGEKQADIVFKRSPFLKNRSKR
jgi:hypothetical protein